MNIVLMWVIAGAAVFGGVDKIFGNRFGLGKRFDEGFALIGPLISGMLGISCLTPILTKALRVSVAPLFVKVGLDPAILGGIIPIDMGGYQLAAELADDARIGLFAGIIITSTFGCTLTFTIPVGFGMIREENRPMFILGTMCGLIILPVTLLVGGLLGGMSLSRTLWQCLPVLILALLLAFGMKQRPVLIARIFTVFAKIIQALSIIGILAALTQYLTGTALFPDILPMPDALLDAALCGIMLIGCLPFAEILNRVLKRPLHALGTRFGMGDRGITGMLLTLVSVTASLGLMHDMDKTDVAVNAAFLVSAACIFGPHLSVCTMYAPELVGTMILSKFVGGICTALFTLWILRRRQVKA